MPHLPFPALLSSAALLAACAGPSPQRTCRPSQVEVVNLAARPVEQLYYGAPGAWGGDLLRGAGMAPGEARPVVLPGVGGYTLRAVWTDGRAAELHGLDPCRNTRVVMAEGGVRAD